ncbi:MAG: histidine kinase [Cereibacter sphaeroides]|uniref:Histidine kinase n=1 Tax=Cereibacter sphaeroides TaxID=1063 RepID=A0A2W5SET7_CERSP|nr:MAG: histidine kinase [Cereibacter sphaeroides]
MRAILADIKLLSGGNPQISKGDGDEPVQAYIAAMPGWKSDLGREMDRIIGATVPGVRKAVKWNSPFYGGAEPGWFLSFHCFAKYVKVTFFAGSSLDPVPPGASRMPNVRYYDIREGAFDEVLFANWVRQASRLHGEKL